MLLSPSLLTALLPVLGRMQLPGPSPPSRCSDGSPFEESGRYPAGPGQGLRVGCDGDFFNSGPSSLARSPLGNLASHRFWGKKAVFSRGVQKLRTITGAGVGELLLSYLPRLLLVALSCGWVIVRHSCFPFGGDCEWFCEGASEGLEHAQLVVREGCVGPCTRACAPPWKSRVNFLLLPEVSFSQNPQRVVALDQITWQLVEQVKGGASPLPQPWTVGTGRPPFCNSAQQERGHPGRSLP